MKILNPSALVIKMEQINRITFCLEAPRKSGVMFWGKAVTILLMDSLEFDRLRGIRKTNNQKDINVHSTMLGSFLLQNFALYLYMPCLFIFLCFTKTHELLPTHRLR